ncbi:MAG: ribosome-associated translation inhibitor RaiA [Pseudomonadota bacterium]
MKTTITFRHMDSSSALKDFVNEHLERLDRYFESAKEAHVILTVEKYMQIAEVVFTAKGVRATGKVSSEDMYKSITGAADKVEKVLKRHHDKIIKPRNGIRTEVGG